MTQQRTHIAFLNCSIVYSPIELSLPRSPKSLLYQKICYSDNLLSHPIYFSHHLFCVEVYR